LSGFNRFNHEEVKAMLLLEQEAYISFLRQLESRLLEQYCGEKYARITRECRIVKTVVRRVCTRFGEITLKITHVKNAAGEFFSPLLQAMGISKYQRIPTDIENRIKDKASKMTYQDTAEDVHNSFELEISRQKVWKINQANNPIAVTSSKNHKVLLADGTKVRSNKGGHLEPKAVMSYDSEKKEKCLLALDAVKSWREIAENLDFKQFRVLVADGEQGLAEALVKLHMVFQFCHQHAIRDLSFYLWQDKLEKTARGEFMKPLKEILYTVQNSTKKYFVDKNKARLLWRIQWADKRIGKLITKLNKRDCEQSAKFLKRNRNYLFTAAKLAITDNLHVPWTTNVAERLMKEIGKRTKKKSMRWSAKGLMSILSGVLKRYFLPPEKRSYKNIYGGDSISG
jgi:hypothetical protein